MAAVRYDDYIPTWGQIKLLFHLLKLNTIPGPWMDNIVLGITNGKLDWVQLRPISNYNEVGDIDSSTNEIILNGLPSGEYTLYYEDNNGKLKNVDPIGKVEV